MKELDELFQTKLKDHTERPSDAAWAQISAQISNRKRKGFFINLSIAASITALLVVGIFWLVLKEPQQGPVIIIAETGNEDALEEMQQIVEVPVIEPETNEQAVANVEQNKLRDQILPNNKVNDVKQIEDMIIETPIIPEPLSNESMMAALEEVDNTKRVEVPAQEDQLVASANDLPSVVITYKRSVSTNMIAEKKEDKDTPLEKVILIAQDIKSGSIGLADLRKAKDNLLDIDLRKIETRFRTN